MWLGERTKPTGTVIINSGFSETISLTSTELADDTNEACQDHRSQESSNSDTTTVAESAGSET